MQELEDILDDDHDMQDMYLGRRAEAEASADVLRDIDTSGLADVPVSASLVFQPDH